MQKIESSEITSESQYMSRRDFLKGMGIASASAMVLAACSGQSVPSTVDSTGIPSEVPTGEPISSTPTEFSEPATSYEAVTNYNNYYEFTTNKEGVAKMAKDFPTSPWQFDVGGLVGNPKTYDIDDLNKFSIQERIYRMRCVEGWSMVIPWMGFPLAELLEEVEPTSNAKYVRFETLYDPEKMPGQNSQWYQWPYIEGLR
jgi:sulfoxide reductase catalytic subunit YedY